MQLSFYLHCSIKVNVKKKSKKDHRRMILTPNVGTYSRSAMAYIHRIHRGLSERECENKEQKRPPQKNPKEDNVRSEDVTTKF